MTPPIKHRDTGRQPTSERLRDLREKLVPKPSQGDVAARLGEGQMWISRRERGDPEPTVDEAILIAEALGYAAEFLIVESEQEELLARLGSLLPKEATFMVRLLAALSYFDETSWRVLTGLIEVAEGKRDQAAPSKTL